MNNFLGQRGLLMTVIILVTMVSMQANKSHAQLISTGVLSERDQIILTLANEAQDPDKPFLAASEWPARTMIVCKRDVLRLPPAFETGEELLESIKGITHVIFNHRDPANSGLAKNFSEIAVQTETLAIQDGGVIIRIRSNTVATPARKPEKAVEKQSDALSSQDSDVPDIEVPPKQ